jgi:tRNA(Ile)-lysidine synthetase-like protein
MPDTPVSVGSAGATSSDELEKSSSRPKPDRLRQSGVQDRKPEFTEVFRDLEGIVHRQHANSKAFHPGSVQADLIGTRGKVEFDGVQLHWRIDGSYCLAKTKRMPWREMFDADKVGSPVTLRHWRPGDRFHPIGLSSTVKLQDFFTNQKVPRAKRRELLLAVTAAGEIFWVENMRISERFKLTKGTTRRLHWRWQRP